MKNFISFQKVFKYYALKTLLFAFIFAFSGQVWGQGVNTYTFAQSSGTYTAVSSTTNLLNNIDDGNTGLIDIGFPFRMGDANFTQFSAGSNGYIRLGNNPANTSYTPISTTSNTYVISGAGGIDGRTTGGVFTEVQGTAPNRVRVIQYSNYRIQLSGGDYVHFQIKLYEGTNVIEVVYGSTTRAANRNMQIGLRGTSGATDWNNRTGSNWAASTAGGANNSTMAWSTTNFPASGQTYTWTPPTASYRYYMYNADLGSSTWCAGETRNVSISIKNTGTATWTNASPQIRVGVKWNTNGTNWDDYHVRTDAGSVAPGATATYSLSIQARNATAGPTYGANLANGTNNLTFDMVNEGNCWFGNNPGTCGAGTATMNMRFVSPNQTITSTPANAITPTPTNGATGVCYAGNGAINQISWAAVAGATGYDVYGGTTNPPGPGDLLSANQAGTSFSVVGLLAPNTTYYWRVAPINACGTNNAGTVWSFTTVATPCYCLPTYSSGGANDRMTNVTLGALNDNPPANNSPYYFNRISVQNSVPVLNIGATTNLSLTFGSDANQFHRVWIDLNNNGIFETTESFTTGTNAGSNGTITLPLAIPTTATQGVVRMRIRGGDDSQPTTSQACGASASNWGQALDYHVNLVLPDYLSQLVSVDFGPSSWCVGETRPVTVRLRNIGLATWFASGSTICPAPANNNQVAVSYKWNADPWYDSYSNNRNLLPHDVAPGQEVDVVINVQTPNGNPLGLNNISFKPIARECAWFISDHSTSAINVSQVTGNPATFGNNTWNVYAYNGADINLNPGNVSYRGFYTQNTLGFNTSALWTGTGSPSDAMGYQGCFVNPDFHTFVHKRQGFPQGCYDLVTDFWDDSTMLFINGDLVWSANFWSGSGANPFTIPYTIGSFTLDANSTIEFRTSEAIGGSGARLNINLINPFISLVSNDTLCSGSDVAELSVDGCGEIRWYESATSCVPLHIGSSYQPSISQSTSYFVTATSGVSSSTNLTSALADNSFFGRAGQMFDVLAANNKTIEITGIQVRPDVSGSQTVRVYFRPGSHVGFHTNPDINGNPPGTGWTQIGNGYSINVTAGNLSPIINLASAITIPAGCTYAIYIQMDTRYRGDYTGSESNSDLTIFAGWGAASSTTPFVMSSAGLRGFRGALHYNVRATTGREVVAAIVRNMSFAPGIISDTICINEQAKLEAFGLAPGGQVAQFDGSQTVVSSPLTSVSNTFTMELWVKPNATRITDTQNNTGIEGVFNTQYAIYPTQAGNDGGAGISVGTNGVTVFEHGNAYMPPLLVHDMNMTGWNHVAVVYNNRIPSLFVNGQFVKTGLISGRATVYPSLGSGGIGGWGNFNGSVDNIRIWDGALSLAQIQEVMYQEEITSVGSRSALAHYNFNNGSLSSSVGSLPNWNTTTTNPNQDYFTYTWSVGPQLPPASLEEVQYSGVINSGGVYNYHVVASDNFCSTPVSAPLEVTVYDGANNAHLIDGITVLAKESCEDNGWTYFVTDDDPDEFLFAINKNGNTFTAEVELVDLPGTTTISQVSGVGPARGTFLIGRYWNVNMTGTINPSNPVSIRFFVDPAEVTQAFNEANALLTTTALPGSAMTPLTFFKAPTNFNPSMMNDGNFTFVPDRTWIAGQFTTGTLNGVTYYEMGGITSFSGGTGGYSVNDGAPLLPVELMSFTATSVENRYVRLDWSTATEINNEGFEVQRSLDGINFETIGWVEGNGNSVVINTYSYNDMEAVSGINYYRLKQIDFDGEFEYTYIVSARLTGVDKLQVENVRPNPAENEIYIDIDTRVDVRTTFTIYNHMGLQVDKFSRVLTEGRNEVKVNTSKYTAGAYYITIENNNAVVTKKFVISR